MRKYLHINLDDQSIEAEELHGEDVIRVGRHYIAKTLLARGVAKIDPLSPDALLIFSAGAGEHDGLVIWWSGSPARISNFTDPG